MRTRQSDFYHQPLPAFGCFKGNFARKPCGDFSHNGKAKQRLVAFERAELAPGESRKLTLSIDPRLLADWNGAGWTIPAGRYRFAIGENAEALGPEVEVTLKARSWKK